MGLAELSTSATQFPTPMQALSATHQFDNWHGSLSDAMGFRLGRSNDTKNLGEMSLGANDHIFKAQDGVTSVNWTNTNELGAPVSVLVCGDFY